MFENSIRKKIADNSKFNNLENSIAGKQNRANPGFNKVSTSTGWSGEQTYRKTPTGAIMHGMKFGSDWMYRKYTTTGEDDFDITELIGVERIQSSIFSQNLYSGRGWGITPNDKGDYTLEIDNLLVRRTMTIWEMVINQLRASNGTFIVGSSAKVAVKESILHLPTVIQSTTNPLIWLITFESGSNLHASQPFKTGDVIASKRFWHKDDTKDGGVGEDAYSTIELVVGTVTDTDFSITNKHTTIQFIINEESVGAPREGMDFVRVASSVASRRGLVVMSSDGNDIGDDSENVNVPFIDVYDNLQTYEDFLSALGGDTDFIKVRMGRLDQLTGNTNEYGLWANVVHLVGAGVEGAINIHYGTRAEFNVLTSTVTDTYHDGDAWIMTDELNNILTWNPDGVDVVGLPLTAFNNPQVYLTIGIEYTIKTFVAGDDFTNSGSIDNNNGTVFRATAKYPTTTYSGDDWVASTLTQYWVDRTSEDIIDNRQWIEDMANFNGFFKEAKNIINVLEMNAVWAKWGEIVDSHIDLLAEATTWAVSSTSYTNAYNALDTYLNTTINWHNLGAYNTEVDGSVWIVKWGNFFDELADLKLAIKVQIDAQVYTDANGRLYKTPTTGVAGLFVGSTHLGYHDGGINWLTYMDNTGNFYLGGTSGNLRWNSTTNALYIAGEIHITNPEDINAGDITDDGTWTNDTTANQAIQDALDAQNTADTKITVFSQNSAPTANTVGDLWYDTDDYILYECTVVPSTWVAISTWSDELGRIRALPSPTTSGLHLGGDYMGYWNSTDGWMNMFTSWGDVFFKGTADTAFFWDYSASRLYIGGIGAGDCYMTTDAGSANLEFYGYYGGSNINFMTIGANIDGTGWWGIELEQRAFIYKNNDSDNAVSTVHSELYNQTTNFVGGISTLVSSTTESATTGLTTKSFMSGIKAQAYVTGGYNGAGILGIADGDSTNTADVYGVYGKAVNAGSGHAWGGYFDTQVFIEDNVQVYGYGKFGVRAVNTAGAIRISIPGSYSVNPAQYGIWFGDTSNHVALYQSANNTLKISDTGSYGSLVINDALFVGSTISFGTATQVKLYKSGAYVIESTDTISTQSSFQIKEIAVAPSGTANYGKLWTKNNAGTTELWFTNDIGGHTQLV